MKHSAFEKIARFGRDRTTLLIVVLAGLGTAHILVRTATYGPSVHQDAVALLSTALNFLAGEGWRDFTGEPLTMWPPLFPLLLVAGGWVGIDLLEAGRWINAAAFGLTILAAGGWLRSNVRSQWLVLAATATISACLPLSHWAAQFRTEPLFVLFALLALMQLASFLNRKTAAPLWWAAVFTALAAITRYPGVALIGTGVLILLPTARQRQTLIFGAISSVPLLAVLARNWAATGNLDLAAGDRANRSWQSFSDGLHQIVEVFRAYIVPPSTPDGFGYLLWPVAGLVVWAAGAVVVRAGRGLDMDGKSPSFGLGLALPFGVFTVIYIAFMVAVVPFTVSQVIDGRYLLPIYVPLLLTAALLLDRFLSIEASGWKMVVRYGLAALVVLATLVHVGFSAQKNLRLTARAHVAGYYPAYAYNTSYWAQFETLNYLRDNQIEGRIYTNYHKHITWFWDWTAAPGKHRHIPRSKMRWTEIEAGAHIVWSYNHRRDLYGYDDTDLRVLPGVEVVAELADGVVLRRTAAEPFDAKGHRTQRQRYVKQLIQQADDQVGRAGWGVYRTGRKLTYFKEPCSPADIQATFVLHVVPIDPTDLRADHQQYGSDNLDFHFDWRGSWLGDQCVAILPLPTYAIRRIHVGQWIAEEERTLWKAKLPADPDEVKRHRAQQQRYVEQLIQQADDPVVRAGWNVYRTGRKLIYHKEPCAPADIQAKFVFHVVPVDRADLPPDRKQYGSDNLDFYFDRYGERIDDQCMAIIPLPAYAINHIYIGQWIAAEDRTVWEAELTPGTGRSSD